MNEKDKNDLYKEFGINDPNEFFEGENERESIRQEILGRLQATKEIQSGQERFLTIRRRKNLMSMAAVLALILVSAALMFYYNNAAFNSNYITVVVPKGQTREVVLPDGSTVWLNAASTLKYPRKFGKKRMVYLLDGEGFFKVVHNKEVPFVVDASGMITNVLGTSFVVKSYKSLSTMSVSVVTGKVAVSDEHKQLSVLVKDQEVVYHKDHRKPSVLKVKAQEKTEWNSGKVILNSANFEELILAVENAYQVKINYDKERFKNCNSTLSFDTKQSLTDVMNIIQDIQGITYQIKEKEVLIAGNGCN
ncbi:FecR family protein [Pedobacter caeni]|uniref:FecR family protein n=1 Tax=Pedobacter caeni TaxID=288992 RepID=A0A1M5HTI7_9SPHI|nr:FecR family protein [Pedobacter caeni]SHG19182.1 FecR family protein [Pedobacter caeni]